MWIIPNPDSLQRLTGKRTNQRKRCRRPTDENRLISFGRRKKRPLLFLRRQTGKKRDNGRPDAS